MIFQGTTSVALYGLGNIRDERLNRMFQVLQRLYCLDSWEWSVEGYCFITYIWFLRHLMQCNGCDLNPKMESRCLLGSIFWFFIRTGLSLCQRNLLKYKTLIFILCRFRLNISAVQNATQNQDKPQECNKWAFLTTVFGLCGMGTWTWMPSWSTGNALDAFLGLNFV